MIKLPFFRRRDADWLVLGLGNPGARYAHTRHNVGYLAVDRALLQAHARLGEVITLGEAPGTTVSFLRASTYMNDSGSALRGRRVDPARLIVVHDELDLPQGTVRLRLGGSENGHNGLKSVTETLGTRDYLRVRIGISRPPKGVPVPDYVLGEFEPGEEIDLAARAITLLVAEGLGRAQNQIH